MQRIAISGVGTCLALWCGGCDDDVTITHVGPDSGADAGLDAGGVLACQAADEAVTLRLANDPALVPLRGCSTDQDCTLHDRPTVACPERGTSLPNCYFPIATQHLDAGLAFLEELEVALCPTLPRDCRVGISCGAADARCVGGHCTWGVRGADAGP